MTHHPLKLRSARKGLGLKKKVVFVMHYLLCPMLCARHVPKPSHLIHLQKVGTIISISQVRKLRLSEVRKLAQGHIDGEWQWWV